MPKIEALPRAWQGWIAVIRNGQVSQIVIGSAIIMVYKEKPLAVATGGVVYFHASPGTEQRVVNSWLDSAPHVRSSSDQFDFILGQVLTQAGLPLTQPVEAEPDPLPPSSPQGAHFQPDQ